jgi:basic amino acid/polyamine antiporter, APA family
MKDDTPAPQPRLLRALGPLMATAVVVGTVIGSGVFKKPQDVADKVPYFGLAALVWILGGLLALLGGLALAEIAVLYPRAGGNYVFLREGYGRPFGFLWGWVEFWIIRSASIAALASIFSEQFHTVLRETVAATPGADVLGFWPQQGLTVAVIVALALVNVRGVRWGGGLQLVVTTVKVASLLAILALPFIVWSFVSPDKAPRLCSENFQTPWPPADKLGFGLLGMMGSALVGVLWAYHGWMNIAPVAEEVRNPQRNIPLSLLGGVGIIIVLYLGANLAYYLVIPQAEMTQMKESAAAPADGSEPAVVQDRTVAIGFSRRLLGPIGVAVAAAAVAISVFGALNGNLLVGPRLLYAMGQDRLAPPALAEVHPRFRTPVLATLVLAAWSCILVLAGAALSRYRLPEIPLGFTTLDLNVPKGKPLFDILTAFAIFGAVIFETLAVSTIFVFRWRYPQAERPYRCLGYPVVPAVYVCILAAVAANYFFSPSERFEALVGVGFIAVGAGVYFLLFRGTKAPLASPPAATGGLVAPEN